MGSMSGFCSLMIVLLVGVASLSTLDPVAAAADLRICGDGLPHACGEALGRRVALNQGPLPNEDCCIGLLLIGKPCHDAYTQAHIKAHDYVGTVPDVLKRSDEVWDKCVDTVGYLFGTAEAPGPSYADDAEVPDPSYSDDAEAPAGPSFSD